MQTVYNVYNYCKFGNFCVTFISSQIISEFLNSRVSVCVSYKVYSDSLFAKIKFLQIFQDLQYVVIRGQVYF